MGETKIELSRDNKPNEWSSSNFSPSTNEGGRHPNLVASSWKNELRWLLSPKQFQNQIILDKSERAGTLHLTLEETIMPV